MTERSGYGQTTLMRRRREAIKGQARRLIISRGIAATTMVDIAEASGIGRKTLYRYFANIEEIAREIIADLAAQAQDWAGPAQAMAGTGREKLRQACRDYCGYCLAERERLLFMYEYDYHFRRADQAPVHLTWAERPNPFRDFIQLGLADGSIGLAAGQVHAVSLTLPNTIFALAQRLIVREAVYRLEYGYSPDDARCLAGLLVDGLP